MLVAWLASRVFDLPRRLLTPMPRRRGAVLDLYPLLWLHRPPLFPAGGLSQSSPPLFPNPTPLPPPMSVFDPSLQRPPAVNPPHRYQREEAIYTRNSPVKSSVVVADDILSLRDPIIFGDRHALVVKRSPTHCPAAPVFDSHHGSLTSASPQWYAPPIRNCHLEHHTAAHVRPRVQLSQVKVKSQPSEIDREQSDQSSPVQTRPDQLHHQRASHQLSGYTHLLLFAV